MALLLAVWIWPADSLGAADTGSGAIGEVSVSRPFFNPTLGEKIRISFVVSAGGELSVLVLDRDGYPVRSLARRQVVEAGKAVFEWDGRGDRGDVVPDEAYSVKIDLVSPAGISTYFPAQSTSADVDVTDVHYDRSSAVLSYKLAKPSRVHIQTGLAPADPHSGKRDGPVLKTVANREPRPGGAVIETWNGLDQTGSYYIPDLPDFVIGVAATALPENALIAIGNKTEAFLERSNGRAGASLISLHSPSHAHHQGLTSLEDASPALLARPSSQCRQL